MTAATMPSCRADARDDVAQADDGDPRDRDGRRDFEGPDHRFLVRLHPRRGAHDDPRDPLGQGP